MLCLAFCICLVVTRKKWQKVWQNVHLPTKLKWESSFDLGKKVISFVKLDHKVILASAGQLQQYIQPAILRFHSLRQQQIAPVLACQLLQTLLIEESQGTSVIRKLYGLPRAMNSCRSASDGAAGTGTTYSKVIDTSHVLGQHKWRASWPS